MKTYKIILMVFFVLTNKISFSQTTMADSLAGTWYLTNSFPSINDSLVYKRVSNVPNNWGYRIEFNSSQRFVDAYFGKCGNDERIHKETGKWELSTITIITSIPISINDGTIHKILHISPDKLVLKKVN